MKSKIIAAALAATLLLGETAKPVEVRLPTVVVGQAFDLQVEWTPGGLVTFSFIPNTATGTVERRSIQLDAASRQVVVSASTGELLLNPLELGR